MAQSHRSPFRYLVPDLHRLKELYEYNHETGHFLLTSCRGGHPKGKVAGTLGNTGYLIIAIDGVRHPAHRLAWLYSHESWPPAYIDHINGVRNDNRLSNLRLATQSQNNANSRIRSDNSTGHKGVVFDHRRKRFRAYIVIAGKQKHLGRFVKFADACAAYERAAEVAFGEFARAA
jgi:hypothetical protein